MSKAGALWGNCHNVFDSAGGFGSYRESGFGREQRRVRKRIVEMTGRAQKSAQAEVGTAVERLFTYADWADKYVGTIQKTALRDITVPVNEPMDVIGIAISVARIYLADGACHCAATR